MQLDALAQPPTASQPLAMLSEPAAVMQGVSKRLKVSGKWVAKHVPSISSLEAPTPVGTPSGQHATRQLHARFETPGGGERQFGEQVLYSLPPAEGESEAEANLECDEFHRA